MIRRKKWLVVCAAFLLLAAVLAVAAWQAQNAFLGPDNGRYFDSDGVPIYYAEAGEGVPLVLLHGFACNGHLEWRKNGVIEALSKTYRVIVPDQRGHGRSDKPHTPEQYGVQMAEDVVRLLDHLNIEKAHVLGYSMGGFVTLKLIALHPERLLSAAPCGAGWELVTDENMAFGEAVAKALETRDGFGPLGERLGLEDAPPTLLDKLMAIVALDYFNERAALAAVMRGMHKLAVTEEALKNNAVPVLTIIGSKDGLLSSTESLTGKMKNHELVVLDGKDHMNTPDTEDFLLALQSFLENHTPE